MVKWYYTVIVGTQPGVYADWSQAAPTVIEISGAIHKKFKTYREAREAFDRAGREGRVRAIQVDPHPDDFGAPAPISAATFLSVAPDYHWQRDFHHNAQYSQNAPPASVAGSSTRHYSTPAIRRRPGNASRKPSSPVPAHNIDLVASIGAGPLRRTMSEYRGNSGQPLHTMLGYADSSRSPSTLSSPSRPAGRSQVYEHADFPGREFSSWQGKNRQNNEQGTVALPGSQGVHSTAAQHGEAEATDTSTNSAPLRSGQTGHLTYRFPGQSQVEDTSETATRKHRRLLDPARAPIGKGQNSVINFLSGLGRARSQGDDSDRRRPSHYSDGIQRSQSSHTRLQTREESHSSLGAPVLSRPSSACSHISLTSSIETIRSTLSFDVDLTQADASEEPENAGSTSPPVPTSPFVASSSLVGVEEIVYGPSTPSQDDLNEGDREVDVPSGEQRHASSSQSGNRGSARGALTPVEHMHSQFDQGDDTLSPLPLPQPLSPLLVASTLPTPTHFWTQNIRQSPTDAVVSSPREVWTTSPPSHFSFEMSSSTASGLGLLTDVASPRLHPLPQSPAAQTFSESPVDRSVRSTDAQSPTRDTESSRDSPQHDNASSLYLSAEDTSSIGTRPIDCGSRSHHNVPLPPSPVSSVANSIIRLQFQPAHRHSPRRSLYPSLAGEDAEPLSPSGLFGLPTPGLSPMQAPAVIRSPAMDPRSPVPSQMRIPGDIMGLLGPSFLVVLRLPRIILEGFPDYHGKR